MFNHISHSFSLIDYETTTIDGKRHYCVNENFYPSITSIMGTLSKDSLVAWREAVGEEEANRISRYAANRGTNLHSICETYLNNNPVKGFMPDALCLFYKIKTILNRINNIHFQEKVVYSDKLKVAGRVDCIAEFDGVLSVIDFKTSRRNKTEEDIQSYFWQATFYALAYMELTGIKVDQIVIIIAGDEKPLVFVKKIRPYIENLVDVVNNYYTNRKLNEDI